MAKVSYINVDPEDKEAFYENVVPQDRFKHSRVTYKRGFPSREKRREYEERSLFTYLSQFWRNMSESEKQEWSEAGDVIGLTNWQCFIHSMAARMRAGLPDLSQPSDVYQAWAGFLNVPNSGDELQIVQPHPKYRWEKKKVPGSKARFKPVEVVEPFSLPLEIGLSYKLDLEVFGPDPIFEFYAIVISEYQGEDILTPLIIEFTPDYPDAWPHFLKIGNTLDFKLNNFKYDETNGNTLDFNFDLLSNFYSGNTLDFDLDNFGYSEMVGNSLDFSFSSHISCDWKRKNAILDDTIGYTVGYSLYFHLKDVKGKVLVDNLKAYHSGQNWVRDSRMDDMRAEFDGGFSRVNRRWQPLVLSGDSDYRSVYPESIIN